MEKLYIFTLLCIVHYAAGLTMWEVLLQNSDLSKITQVIQEKAPNFKDHLASNSLASSNAYTLFAPVNSVWTIEPSSMTVNQVLYHLVRYEKLTASTLETTQKIVSLASNRWLWFSKVGSKVYVNQAEITSSISTASNGIIHKINHVLVDPSSNNAESYIGTPETLGFKRLVDALPTGDVHEALVSFDHASDPNFPITVFVPSTVSLNSISDSIKDELKNDTNQLKRVLESHIIKQHVYFTSHLRGTTAEIPTLGDPLKTIPNSDGSLSVKVGSSSAKIIHGNIAITNGVLHIIDNILNFVYSTMWSRIKEDELLSQLEAKLLGQTEIINGLQDNSQGTYFCPPDDAFIEASSAYNRLSSSNRTQILKMHWLSTTQTLESLGNGNSYTTVSGYGLTTEVEINETTNERRTYVMVDHVRALVVTSDFGTTNGILHKIDTILGLPYRTIPQEIAHNSLTMNRMNILLSEAGLTSSLEEQTNQWTVFAVTDKDLVAINNTDANNQSTFGRILFTDNQYNNLKTKIVKRHVVSGRFYTDGVTETNTPNLVTQSGESLVMFRRNNEFYVSLVGMQNTEAKIVQRDIAVTNGVVMVVNDLISSGDPELSASTSGSGTLTTSLALIFTMFIFLLNEKRL